MKIYLAGRNDRDLTRTHWRYQLTLGACERVADGPLWTFEKKALLGSYTYTGPFHAVERIEDPTFNDHSLRMAAIRCSDLVFTWLPSPKAIHELGIAAGSGIKTAIGGTSGFWRAGGCAEAYSDYRIEAPAPPSALVEAVKQVQASGHFFNGVWRQMVGKFGSRCLVCGERTEVGEDIMWRKKNEDSGGDVCHVECFVLNAPHRVMDEDLQALGMELLRKRVRRLEQENARLIETARDLAALT